MSVITEIRKPVKLRQTVPEYLIYEVVRGKPIYYKGYKDVLNGTKTKEEIKMESRLQSWLKAHLAAYLLNQLFPKGFDVVVGELGVHISKENKRGADVAIFKIEDMILDSHFSNLPPEIVIEIDITADLEGMDVIDYLSEKIQDYHNFGVKKVIWIFTKNRNIMVATPVRPWLTFAWDTDIELMGGATMNMADITKNRQILG